MTKIITRYKHVFYYFVIVVFVAEAIYVSRHVYSAEIAIQHLAIYLASFPMLCLWYELYLKVKLFFISKKGDLNK